MAVKPINSKENGTKTETEEADVYFAISQEERDKIPANDFAGPHKSFPIRSQEDLDNAARLIGHAADPEKVKAAIKRIAKRKGLTLPESWDDTDGEAGDGKEDKAKMGGESEVSNSTNTILVETVSCLEEASLPISNEQVAKFTFRWE